MTGWVVGCQDGWMDGVYVYTYLRMLMCRDVVYTWARRFVVLDFLCI